MILIVDNNGAVYIEKNCSSAGCTSHMYARIYFLVYLKEEGLITTVGTPVNNRSSELFTKDLPATDFSNNMNRYCGDNGYYNLTKV